MPTDRCKSLHVSLSRRKESERLMVWMRDGQEASLTIRHNQTTFSRSGIAEGQAIESGILRPADVLFVEYWQNGRVQAYALFQYVGPGVAGVLYSQGFEFTTYAVNLQHQLEGAGNKKKSERMVQQRMGILIDPAADKLVFVRFRQNMLVELVVRNIAGAWIWYDVAFCRRDDKLYLVKTEIGEPDVLTVYCEEGELAGIYWADPDLVPNARINTLAGGPCLRLLQLPAFLRDGQFKAFCAELGSAAEMVPCVCCQDWFPISNDLPEEDQRLCEHIAFCPDCRIYSSPYFPGKEQEMEHCPHRTADGLYFAQGGQRALGSEGEFAPVPGMHLVNSEPVETFPQAYIEPGATFTLIEWTPGSQFAVQPSRPWHDWIDPLVFRDGALLDKQGRPYSLREVLALYFIPILEPEQATPVNQALIDKYRAMIVAGQICGYAIWGVSSVDLYFPQWKDTDGRWHLFKQDNENRFVRSADLDFIEHFLGFFTSGSIEYR